MQRWKRGSVHRENFGKVLLNQPEARMFWIPRKDDNKLARDSSHLRQALLAMRPVVNRQDRKCRVKGLIVKWQLTCRCLHDWRGPSWTLPDHFN